jgi:hypothetical protein
MSLKEINDLNFGILTIRDVITLCQRFRVYAVVNAGDLMGFVPEYKK